MEASALQAPRVLAPARARVGASFLRLRSDEQLVALFRAGNDDAFRAIHDRYRGRLFAYARQMLSGRQDAEDAMQDVFLRAYAGLRASDRELALRAWLYRVAHNRCIDELRRPVSPAPEQIELCAAVDDPVALADRRESLRRLIGDIRRLPDHQRSALLMRELGGMSYADVAGALGISVPAVKSLLVRARMGLVQAIEARDTSCSEIRTELMVAHDRRVRPGARARRHMRDCAGCREFRRDLRGVCRQLAALAPALGPLGVVSKLLGLGGGAGGGAAASGAGGAVSGGGAAAGGAVGGTGTAASAGALASGVGHVATLLAATVVAAGGAVEIQHTIAPPRVAHHARVTTAHRSAPDRSSPQILLPAQPTAARASTAGSVSPSSSVASKGPSATRSSTASTAGASSRSARNSTSMHVSGIAPIDQLTGTTPTTAPSAGSTPPASGDQSTGSPGPNGTSPTTGTGTATGTAPAGGATGTACTPVSTACQSAPPSGSTSGGTSTGGSSGGTTGGGGETAW